MDVEDCIVILYGYDSVTGDWYPFQVDVDGKLVTV